MSGLPPFPPGPSPLLLPPREGEAWGCLDLPGHPDRRIEARGPFQSSPVPPLDQVAFYVNDFALSHESPWQIPHLTAGAPETPPPPDPGVFPASWDAPGHAAFHAVFGDAMQAIRQRQLLKVVPVSNATAHLTKDPAPALHRLLHPARIAGMGHAAAWCHGAGGFATITPEVLFELSGTRLTTMALAGTVDAEHEADLRQGPKLAREHEIVVDELHRRLANLGRVSLTAREIVPLGNVRHLRTTLTVDLPSVPQGQALNDLIHLLHPTPALGISPRTPETLAELNSYRDRCGVPAAFGAPFGVAWPGGAVFLVAIRGLFWQGHTLHLPAGGGLVAGSVFENEWAELELKRNWVRHAFHLDAPHG